MTSQEYKTNGKKGLFDKQFTIERLTAIGNPLEKISNVIDFEVFRNTLESKLLNTEKKSNAGAKPYDVVLMFKILILQRYYGLGDTQIEYICNIATSFPIKYEYCDDEIENVLLKIGINCYKKLYVDNKKDKGTNEERIVFYNGQIIDSGALTEQYLNVFENRNAKMLFVVPDINNTLLGKNILNKIRDNSNIKLFIPNGKNRLEKIEQIKNAICDFEPTIAFMHFLPNDVVGFVSFSPFKNFLKFFIVHNDHTFWLGKNCADYFIEFRNFGVSLTFERRKIPIEKILKIPYYPIISGNKFQGFPFDRKNKIVGVSGANLYKYYADKDLTYFKIIKELLEENPRFVFCLCGWGNIKPITEFIKLNGLQNRFFYLGKRNDFYELIGNCDILFESFPVKGGLTVLMATQQKIPAIGISTYNNPSGALEDLLEIENYKQPKNYEEFKIESNKLINDNNYRVDLAEKLNENKYNKTDFEIALNQLINGIYEIIKPKNMLKLKLIDDAYLEEYLNKPEATMSNLLYRKWYIIGNALPVFEKIKIIFRILMIGKIDSIKNITKILLKKVS